jgi:hypothetical protein
MSVKKNHQTFSKKRFKLKTTVRLSVIVVLAMLTSPGWVLAEKYPAPTGEALAKLLFPLIEHDKFEELENIHDDIVENRLKTIHGRSRLLPYYWIIGSYTSDTHIKPLDFIARWEAATPESATPKTAHVQALIRAAWDARGKGFINGIDQNALNRFDKPAT